MAREYGEAYTGPDGLLHYPWSDPDTGETGEDLANPEAPGPAEETPAPAAPAAPAAQRMGGVVLDDSQGPTSPVTLTPAGPGLSVAGGQVFTAPVPGPAPVAPPGTQDSAASAPTPAPGPQPPQASPTPAGPAQATAAASPTAQAQAPAGPAQANVMPADVYTALSQRMEWAAQGALQLSQARGVLMEPVLTGNTWTFRVVTDPQHPNGIPTLGAGLNAAQISELAARAAASYAAATGWIEDPTTHQRIQTPAALLTAAQTAHEGSATALNAAERAYTAGARTVLTNAQAQQAGAEATYTAGARTTLTNAQAAVEQANARKADIDAAVARAGQTGTYVDPVTGQSIQTLQAQRQQVENDLTRAQTAYQQARVGLEAAQLTGVYNGQQTLAGQQQAFEQQRTVAQLAANPRNYLEASFLANARGGLAGQAPANQVSATTPAASFQAPGGGTAPPRGIMGEQAGGAINPALTGAGQPAQAGQPGGPDHLATLESAGSGARLHFFQAPTGADSIPLSAATRALMENRPVPSSGAIVGPGGGYTSGSEFRRAFNPNQINSRDLERLAPSERAQYEAAGSYAGYSPEDLQHAEQAGRPQFHAPSVGVVG